MKHVCEHKCFTESPTATFIGFKQHQAFELAESEPTLNPHLSENAKKGERDEFGSVRCKMDKLRVITKIGPWRVRCQSTVFLVADRILSGPFFIPVTR
jgi:hypothetical protein